MLSEDEKRTVAHFLGRRRHSFDSVFEFGVYILLTSTNRLKRDLYRRLVR